jgi:hypothetical protein
MRAEFLARSNGAQRFKSDHRRHIRARDDDAVFEDGGDDAVISAPRSDFYCYGRLLLGRGAHEAEQRGRFEFRLAVHSAASTGRGGLIDA